MAKSQRDLNGWLFSLEQLGTPVAETGRRASRRTKASDAEDELVLTRESDGLVIKKGTCLVVNQPVKKGDPNTLVEEVALVKEIRLGNVNYIDLVVLWFLRVGDIDTQFLPKDETTAEPNTYKNELYITEYREDVRIAQISGVVDVLSAEDLPQHYTDEYVCRRACDSVGERFSSPFSFKKMLEMFMRDLAEFVDFIRHETALLKAKSRHGTLSTPATPRKPPAKKKVPVYAESDSETDDSDLESDSAVLSHDSDEDDEDIAQDNDLSSDLDAEPGNESDSEFGAGTKKKRATARKQKPAKPKKPARSKSAKADAAGELTPRKRGRPAGSPTKLHDDDRKAINSMLSPLKKRLRLKGDLAKPSLSPSKPSKQQLQVSKNKQLGDVFNDGTLSVDSTSEIFKELKSKLHTSMRLSALPCRDNEFISVYYNLETAITEQTGCCLYVSGTPGVGKTATIREVIAQLKDLIPTQELNDFDYIEINGLKLLTPQVAYEILWEKVSGLKVSASNAAILLESYFSGDEQDTERKPLVVLVDELDQIATKKQNVMYNLFNWPTYRYLKLIVVAVANTMDLPERILSNKISSRLGLRRIQFIGYTYEQLGIIIKHRLEMVSKLNSKKKRKVIVNLDAISYASRKVGSVSGDARRALTICRRAVEMAELEFNIKQSMGEEGDGDVHVSISHISKAIIETTNSPISQFLKSLPFEHKLVLVAVLLRIRRSGLGENSLGDIIDEMKITLTSLAPKIINNGNISVLSLLYGEGLVPLANSQALNVRLLRFKQVLNELVENGILLQQKIKGERYRMMHLNISQEEILSVLKDDPEISGLL